MWLKCRHDLLLQESRHVGDEMQKARDCLGAEANACQPNAVLTHKRPAGAVDGLHEEDRLLHLDKKIKVEAV